jgi:hypothetical protein
MDIGLDQTLRLPHLQPHLQLLHQVHLRLLVQLLLLQAQVLHVRNLQVLALQLVNL